MRSDFQIVAVKSDKVFLADLDMGRMSVTNDAESVVSYVARKYPNRRIIYKDSDGRWYELQHNDGNFSGFKPYGEELP